MFWQLAGGARGAMMVALLAAAGTLVPMKFGFLFLDPVILLAYVAVAVLFTSDFVARGVVGSTDPEAVRHTAILGTFYGWACWAAILGTAFVALAAMKGRPVLPPPFTLIALIIFTLAAAWLTACCTAVVSLNVLTVKTARDMMRLGFFFVLLVLLVAPRLLPPEWQRPVSRFVTGSSLRPLLLIACPVFLLAGAGLLRHTRRLILDRKAGLSITQLDESNTSRSDARPPIEGE